MFPGGGPGWALLLIRFAVAIGLLLDSGAHPFNVLANNDFLARAAVAAFLIAGVLTPVFAAAAVALVFADLIAAGIANFPMAILVSLDAMALVLMGPGAYSVDARRFGRRVLMTSDRQKGNPRSPKR
jgi:hypothetical protein